MISNSFTFALGPKFLDCPDDIEASDPKDPMNDAEDAEDLEHQQEEAVHANEETSLLLPQRAARDVTHYQYGIIARCQTAFASLPTFLQQTLSFLSMFLNPPFIGTCIGALIGLVPALHTLFFSDQQHGGYLNAWLTAALKNVGDLFAALQVIVVGIKLSSSLLKWKKGEASGSMPWGPWATVTFVRFVLWPAISIPLIYAFATKTSWLDDEPILWFAMMLMPVGPPALSITAMADVSGADETQKLSIAKFLTVCLSDPTRQRPTKYKLTPHAGLLRRLTAHLFLCCRGSESQPGRSVLKTVCPIPIPSHGEVACTKKANQHRGFYPDALSFSVSRKYCIYYNACTNKTSDVSKMITSLSVNVVAIRVTMTIVNHCW